MSYAENVEKLYTLHQILIASVSGNTFKFDGKTFTLVNAENAIETDDASLQTSALPQALQNPTLSFGDVFLHITKTLETPPRLIASPYVYLSHIKGRTEIAAVKLCYLNSAETPVFMPVTPLQIASISEAEGCTAKILKSHINITDTQAQQLIDLIDLVQEEVGDSAKYNLKADTAALQFALWSSEGVLDAYSTLAKAIQPCVADVEYQGIVSGTPEKVLGFESHLILAENAKYPALPISVVVATKSDDELVQTISAKITLLCDKYDAELLQQTKLIKQQVAQIAELTLRIETLEKALAEQRTNSIPTPQAVVQPVVKPTPIPQAVVPPVVNPTPTPQAVVPPAVDVGIDIPTFIALDDESRIAILAELIPSYQQETFFSFLKNNYSPDLNTALKNITTSARTSNQAVYTFLCNFWKFVTLRTTTPTAPVTPASVTPASGKLTFCKMKFGLYIYTDENNMIVSSPAKLH